MDERLRELERKARTDPQARLQLAKERIRSVTVDELWQEFEYLFDLVEQQPWNDTNVQLLKDLCARLPATDPTHVQDDQQHVVLKHPAMLDNDRTPARLRNVVIFGGKYQGMLQFQESERIVIFGGQFRAAAFENSKHILIFNGQFDCAFRECTDLTIVDGLFRTITQPSDHALILGGEFHQDVLGDTLTILGGRFPYHRFASTLGAEVRIWLPDEFLKEPAIPIDAQVAALGIGTLGVDQVWRNADTSLHSGLGRTRTARTKFYLKTCPEQDATSPELHTIVTQVNRIPDILALLRTDTRITRATRSTFLDAHYAALAQKAKPCFN